MADRDLADSRDIWTHGGSEELRDLLKSVLISELLLRPDSEKAAYFCSPWISDFVLCQNQYRQYSALFPDMYDEPEIRFSDFLKRLQLRKPVRVVTTRNSVSTGFVNRLRALEVSNLSVRFAGEEFHEKGILFPSFYFEGSMNITFSGVYIKGEKIVYHVAANAEGKGKVSGAYLEFDRLWESLDSDDKS